jgi:hypothetical protein
VRVEVSGAAGRANGVVADAEIFGERLTIELGAPASIRGRIVDVEGKPVATRRVSARMTGPSEESSQRSAPTGATAPSRSTRWRRATSAGRRGGRLRRRARSRAHTPTSTDS